jgi:hypothetical protein
VQLSARLYSAFRARLRSSKTPPDSQSNKTQQKFSGFIDDVRHASTYAPYCDGYFTDKAMANLMRDSRVGVDGDFGCRVFSADNKEDFLLWLEELKSSMTAQPAEDLGWAYPQKYPLKKK